MQWIKLSNKSLEDKLKLQNLLPCKGFYPKHLTPSLCWHYKHVGAVEGGMDIRRNLQIAKANFVGCKCILNITTNNDICLVGTCSTNCNTSNAKSDLKLKCTHLS